jgi:Exotoxin A binding
MLSLSVWINYSILVRSAKLFRVGSFCQNVCSGDLQSLVDFRNACLAFEKVLVAYRLILPISRNATSKSSALAFSKSAIVRNTSKRAARIRRWSKWHFGKSARLLNALDAVGALREDCGQALDVVFCLRIIVNPRGETVSASVMSRT